MVSVGVGVSVGVEVSVGVGVGDGDGDGEGDGDGVLLTRVSAFCRPLTVGFSWTRAPRIPAAPPPLLAIPEMICPGGVAGLRVPLAGAAGAEPDVESEGADVVAGRFPLPFDPLPLPGFAPANGAAAIATVASVAAATFHFI